ncbi:MAG: hypothetical protein GXO56_03170, partial [Chloroflexi bacterium]|nr:hypothetical protein [Chloroflexota bacterium]
AQAIDLENLPPELQAQLQAIARQLQELGPQGLLVAQARDGAVAALRGEASREALSAQLQEIAAQIRANEPPDSEWGEVACFLDAVIALLADQPPPPVPARYAEDFAAVLQAKGI